MLIPIGTTMEHKRRPLVTYWLVAVNMLIFAAQWAIDRSGGLTSQSEFIRSLTGLEYDARLSSGNFHLYSLITYQFLHAGWMHIIFNMIFLIPFGKAVEDRMGHVGFALLYLGCGAIAGFIHTLFYINPVIGASGSVCAIVSAFVVLAPKTYIKVILVFFIIGIYTVPSLLLVAFFVAFDTFSLLSSLLGNQQNPTAWVVHIIGYLFGFSITYLLLTLGVIYSTEFDLRSMFLQSSRRRLFRNAVKQNHETNFQTSVSEHPDASIQSSIETNALNGNIQTAVKSYLREVKENPAFKIDPQTLHLVGSSLMSEGNVSEGAHAFENYLKQYANAKDCCEVALLLAAKYIRILNNPQRARELLSTYSSTFSAAHQQLVHDLKKELKI